MRAAADPTPAAAPDRDPERRGPAPGRAGKKAVVGYLAREQWLQLKHLTLEEETSVQALVLEGIEHVLNTRGVATS